MTATNGKPLFRLQAVQETSPKIGANRSQINAERRHTTEQLMNDAATMSKSKGKERTIYTYEVIREAGTVGGMIHRYRQSGQ